MNRKIIGASVILLVLMLAIGVTSYAAEKETVGTKAKNFWQRLFNYPANVTQESATVVAETGKRGTAVTTKEVKRVGQVTSGEVEKSKELVTEPITGTAETVVKAVTETVQIPVTAAKDEPKTAESK